MTAGGDRPLPPPGEAAVAARVEPVLSTPRLLMHRLGPAHLPDLLALYADPEVHRFLKSLDEVGHLQRIEESARMWRERGHGRVAVLERSSGRFLGRSGLQYWPSHDEVEITWALRRDAWGQGFATEAARAWLGWAWENLDVPYVTAYVDPQNEPSRGVAERVGMSVLRRDRQHEREVLVYAARPPDVPAQGGS